MASSKHTKMAKEKAVRIFDEHYFRRFDLFLFFTAIALVIAMFLRMTTASHRGSYGIVLILCQADLIIHERNGVEEEEEKTWQWNAAANDAGSLVYTFIAPT